MPDVDFYKDRHKFLGASEVAQVMGLSPFGSALDVYNRKMGVQQPAFTSEAMERGNRQEQFVLNEFAAQFNCEIRNQQLRVLHPEPYYGWAGATLDGVAYQGLVPLGVVEAKTITTGLYVKPPVYYLIQVLWQLWVTGMPEGYLAVWSGKESKFFAYKICIADHADLLQEMVDTCSTFWNENIVKQVPPPPPKVKERQEMELPNDLLDQYDALGVVIKQQEKQREQVKKLILEKLGTEENIHAENGQFKVSVTRVETNRLSQKKLAEAHPDLIAQYTEPSYSIRLDVKRVGLPNG